jgi:hypothetical protein
MRVSHAFAMRALSQPVSFVGPENPKPGIDGITRSNASAASPPCERGSVSGPITSRNSATEPGHPCVRISGSAFGSGERTCRKCTLVPSIVVANCGNSLSTASCLRQSNEVRQCSAISFTKSSATP